MEIQCLPRGESTVLDKRRPVDAALRKLQPGQILVIVPATKTTQHTFCARAREIGIRIETGIDGERLEVALIAGRPEHADPKPRKGAILETVRAYIDTQDGARQVDIAVGCGIAASQALNATKKLSSFGTIHRKAHKWYGGPAESPNIIG